MAAGQLAHADLVGDLHGDGCIIEDSTHWQSEGEIKKFSQLPGLLNYYYRDNVGQ